MASTPQSLMNYIRLVAGAWRDDPREDAELLACYLETRDERAFATLMWRHGPMVWQCCARVLGNSPDAEDAFQSAFLALSRQAGKLRASTLAGWLHQVARRAALDVNTKIKRHQKRELQLQIEIQPEMKENAGRTELYTALDKELADLPEKLRVPLVLHFLEGKTLEDSARIVGCSRRDLGRRLEKGEELLRKRLEQRGLTLGVGSVAAILGDKSSVSAIPSRLIETTMRAAVAFQGGSFSGEAAEGAQQLLNALKVENALRSGWWSVLVGVFCLGICGAGIAAWRMYGGGSDLAQSALPIKSVESKPESKSSNSRLDRYGDPLPEGALARLGTIRFRSNTLMGSVTFSPDGKTAIALSNDHLLVWEIPSGKRLQSISSSTNSSWEYSDSIAVSNLSKLVVIGTFNGGVELVDLSSGRHVGHLEGSKNHAIRDLVILPDGKTLAASILDNRTVHFWNISTGKEIRRQEISPSDSKQKICLMSFASDGQKMAVGQENGLVQLLDLTTGKVVGSIKISAKRSKVESAAFTTDGRKLVTAGTDGCVTIWEVATCKALIKMKGCQDFQTVRFSPDGKVLATLGSVGGIQLWNVENGAKLHALGISPFYSGLFSHNLSFSPDSKTLIEAGCVQTLKLWDVSTGNLLHTEEGHEYAVNTVAFAPDGKSLTSGNGIFPGTSGGLSTPILMWNTSTGKLCRQQVERKPDERVQSILAFDSTEDSKGEIVYSPDGSVIASVGSGEKYQDTVWIWDAVNGKRLRVLKGLVGESGYVGAVAFAPDNKTLAMVHSDGKTVDLCEVATGKRLRSMEACDWAGQLIGLKDGELGGAEAVAFSPDGRKLISVHKDGLVLWNATTGNQLDIWAIPRDRHGKANATSVAFSSDGRIVISGGDCVDKAIHLWEVASRQERLKIPSMGGGGRVAFSTDARFIAATDKNETVRLWDAITGQQLHQFPRGQGRVCSLAFSPHNKTLASGNDDTTVLIWDVSAWSNRPERSEENLTPVQLKEYWSALADANASKAYQALGKLIAASDQAVPMLAEQIKFKHTIDAQRVVKLIADLDNDVFQVRSNSRDELQKLGDLAEPYLRQALNNKPTVELRQSVEELLKKLHDSRISAKLLQRLRGVEALERIDTDASRRVLRELAESGLHGEVEEQSQFALQRLSRRLR